jgi:hypothetical protein
MRGRNFVITSVRRAQDAEKSCARTANGVSVGRASACLVLIFEMWQNSKEDRLKPVLQKNI